MAELLFGLDVNPAAQQLEKVFKRAELADTLGFDLLTSQDHPYNRHFLDTWTMLAVLAGLTKRVHLGTNVANLPLRPPAMLAKQAASLDVLSGGRLELGLGAGAFWKGIMAYGGPDRTPGEAVSAFEEGLHILRTMWDKPGVPFTFEGDYYHLKGALPGPAPAHRIPIWVGAQGPRMLRLTGRLADGIIVSVSYVQPSELKELNAHIDEGAEEAGRSPIEIRRGYNVMGTVRPGNGKGEILKEGGIQGGVQYWVDTLLDLHRTYRQDTFIFWPNGDDPTGQIERFAHEVMPAVCANLS